ncbi:MAG: cytochrome-c peroxidase [Verrucomicrobia bacterium]|nr:cytochrome-c peroxidase [Verrucomicrobiota bacterium]
MPVPLDNPLTAEKIELGRRLFFDPGLSRDGTVSCATCHQAEKAFTDGRRIPLGIEQRAGRRNVPTLLNCAYGKSLFWDGRVVSLEDQALLPLTNPTEMGNTLEAILERLRSDSTYLRLFGAAFGEGPITDHQVAAALASYQRTLVAANSPYDRYVLLKDETALSEPARRGLELFRSKARCAHCHEGELFTDQKFHNTGVSWGKEPLDLGRYEHTRREGDQGKFKTPTLRHLTLTAPYMHDGSLATLEDVIDFYDRGANPNPHLDGAIQPLNLSAAEKADLLVFLECLSQPSHGRLSMETVAVGGAETRPVRSGE